MILGDKFVVDNKAYSETLRFIAVENFETEALPHLNDLYRTALRFVQDKGEAEDIVQEAYLQAWKSYERYETGTNCRAWLYKILFYKLDHYRRRQYNQWKYIKETDETITENAVYEPSVEQRLCDEDVLNALHNLPLKYREVILLADLEEFAYKEISQRLNIPIGTVMSRLNRGRTKLRGMLAGVAKEYGIAKSLNKPQDVPPFGYAQAFA